MFQPQRGFVRLAAAAAVGASCLAVAACGVGGSSPVAASLTVAPSPARTVDPLAHQTGQEIVMEAVDNAEAAPSMTVAGTLTKSGQVYDASFGFKAAQGCTMTVSHSGAQFLKLILIGKTVYLKPTAKFFTSPLVGAKASEANAFASLLDGRYLKVPSTDKTAASVVAMCNVSHAIGANQPVGRYLRERLITLHGVRVVPVKLSDGSTDYITDTAKPEFVEAYVPAGTKNGSGKLTISVGAPVTLTAPPASQVVDGTALGM